MQQPFLAIVVIVLISGHSFCFKEPLPVVIAPNFVECKCDLSDPTNTSKFNGSLFYFHKWALEQAGYAEGVDFYFLCKDLFDMVFGMNRTSSFFFYQDQAISISTLTLPFGDFYRGISKNDGISVLFKEQSLGWKFLLTIEMNFFIILIIALIIISILFYIVEDKTYGISFCMSHFLSSFCYQIDMVPKSLPGKILNIAWLFCTLVFVTDFIGKLLAQTDEIHYFEKLRDYEIYHKIDLPITNNFLYSLLLSKNFNPRPFLPDIYTTDMIYQYIDGHPDMTYISMLDLDAMYFELKDCTMHRVYINLLPMDMITPFQFNVSRKEVQRYAAAQIDLYEVMLPKYWSKSMLNQSDLAFEKNLCKQYPLKSHYTLYDFHKLWFIYLTGIGIACISRILDFIVEKYYSVLKKQKRTHGLLFDIEKKLLKRTKKFYKIFSKYSLTLLITMNAIMRAKHMLKFEKNKGKLPNKKLTQNYKKILLESAKKKFLKARKHYNKKALFIRVGKMLKKHYAIPNFVHHFHSKLEVRSKSQLKPSYSKSLKIMNWLLDYHFYKFDNTKKGRFYFNQHPEINKNLSHEELFLFMAYKHRMTKMFNHCININYRYIRKSYKLEDYQLKITNLKNKKEVLGSIVGLLKIIRNKNENEIDIPISKQEIKPKNEKKKKIVTIPGVKKLFGWLPAIRGKTVNQIHPEETIKTQ